MSHSESFAAATSASGSTPARASQSACGRLRLRAAPDAKEPSVSEPSLFDRHLSVRHGGGYGPRVRDETVDDVVDEFGFSLVDVYAFGKLIRARRDADEFPRERSHARHALGVRHHLTHRLAANVAHEPEYGGPQEFFEGDARE